MTTPDIKDDRFWRAVKMDYDAHMLGKTGFRHGYKVILFERGFHLLFWHRVQIQLRKVPFIGTFIARIVWYFSSCLYASEVSMFCTIRGGIYIPHASGIVIGNSVVIETGVTILQGVTIGKNRGVERYPVIGRNAFLGAGCKITGGITIGENVAIGANAVVLKDVPANSIAVGVPAVIKAKKQDA
tara:strand:- start:1476 stop:2030 length:555 start_codon:yes stop_codon:yes gene_type:complete